MKLQVQIALHSGKEEREKHLRAKKEEKQSTMAVCRSAKLEQKKLVLSFHDELSVTVCCFLERKAV